MIIKKPFGYMGSKGRFYKEIKEIFEENRRDKFVDLFAGAMEVPLNIREEFKSEEIKYRKISKKIRNYKNNYK